MGPRSAVGPAFRRPVTILAQRPASPGHGSRDPSHHGIRRRSRRAGLSGTGRPVIPGAAGDTTGASAAVVGAIRGTTGPARIGKVGNFSGGPRDRRITGRGGSP